MHRLYDELKQYSLDDAIDFEKSDRQFLALEKLHDNKLFDDVNYLFLTIANALVCYQLSGKGEDYWEEFGVALEGQRIDDFSDIEMFFEDFLPASKNNKRFVNIKLKRIQKLEKFYNEFLQNAEIYYADMNKLVHDLSNIMNQKSDAKTIVFSIKMFSYSARNVFGYLEYFPKDMMIPIDSRLENLYKKYNTDIDHISKKDIQEFYMNLAKKLNIQPLHLDSILWVNYDELMNV
ncbi:MAG: N-glycosylase/DNA lyase [Candidatus Moraniibacteriota bacterium]|jgi:DNA-(apurinic or apyrimidinic site) lyase